VTERTTFKYEWTNVRTSEQTNGDNNWGDDFALMFVCKASLKVHIFLHRVIQPVH